MINIIKRLTFSFWLTALAVCFLGVIQASAATIEVDTTLDEIGLTNCSLREAIIIANTNDSPPVAASFDCTVTGNYDDGPNGEDTITFDLNTNPGTFRITDNAERDFDISSNIIFNGNVNGGTIRTDMSGTNTNDVVIDRVFHIAGTGLNVSFNNVIIFEGSPGVGEIGGGVYIEGDNNTVGFNNVEIHDNSASHGGGIAANGNGITIDLTGTEISSNNTYAGNGGGIYNLGDNITINSTGNTAIFSNTAFDGGGIYGSVNGITINMMDTTIGDTITGNIAANNGGGIYLEGNDNFINMDYQNNPSTITYNSAGFDGGGIYVEGSNTIIAIYSGFVTYNSAANYGGGIYADISNEINLNAATVANNTADVNGGGMFVNGTTNIGTSTTISSNTATNGYGGGIYNFDSGTLAIDTSSIEYNVSEIDGGGIYNESENNVILVSALFTGNETNTGAGGGLFNYNGDVSISGTSTFDANVANTYGGGIVNFCENPANPNDPADPVCIVNISDAEIMDNEASNEYGGGIVNIGNYAQVNISNTNIHENLASTYGGGIYNDSTLTINASSIINNNNAGISGGGIYNVNTGTVDLSGASEVNNNDAFESGGGIYNAGTMTIHEASNVNGNGDNITPESGGGIYNIGTLEINEGSNVNGNYSLLAGGGITNFGGGNTNINSSTIDSNSMGDNNGNGSGGGIYNSGTNSSLTLTSSTISNNTSEDHGGGIYNELEATLIIQNSTVSGNVSIITQSNGIYTSSSVETAISSSTIVYNFDYEINVDSNASLRISNSIVGDNNNTEENCTGNIISEGYNLESGTSCGFTHTDDLLPTTDLDITSLADHGGPTLTHLPNVNSPAVDSGIKQFDFDQRGFPRSDNPFSDVGSVERNAPTIIVYKIVDNTGGGTAIPADFTFLIENTATNETLAQFSGSSDGVMIQVAPGTAYDVGEFTSFLPYTTSSSGDCLGTINDGEFKECTFVNTYDPTVEQGDLTVIKQIINDDTPPGTAVVGDFDFFIVDSNNNSVQVTSGSTTTLIAGTYEITETGPTNDYFASFNIDCSTNTNGNGEVTISNGDNLTCQITNNDGIPYTNPNGDQYIIVKKEVVNTGGGTKSASDFTIKVNKTHLGIPYNPQTFPGDSSGTTVVLDLGTEYDVYEDDLNDNYTPTLQGDCYQAAGTNVDPNDPPKECIITNTYNPPVIPPPVLPPGSTPPSGGSAGGSPGIISGGSSGSSGGNNVGGDNPPVDVPDLPEACTSTFSDYDNEVAIWLVCGGYAHGPGDNLQFFSKYEDIVYGHFVKLLVRTSGLITEPHVIGSGVDQYIEKLKNTAATTALVDEQRALEFITVEEANQLTSAVTGSVVDFGDNVSSASNFLERSHAAEVLYGLFANP
jgi:hypothetical protein